MTTRPLLLTGASVVDVRTGSVVADRTILVRDGRIAAVEGEVAGSDVTGASWEIPGTSLHQEFDEPAASPAGGPS